jgi:hypothetical protein
MSKKIALVVGNSDYLNIAKLKNPTNDSFDMKNSLESIGFTVFYGENLRQNEFKNLIRDFSNASKSAEVSLFYFAGHGVQYQNRNFFLPIDSDIFHEDEIPDNSVALDFVENRVEDARANLNLFFIDACRDNPFENSNGRSMNLSRGLVNPQMHFTNQSAIAFATAPNQIAFDNPKERNGTYTKHLLKYISQKGLELDKILKWTLRDVIQETGNKQVPWIHQKIFDDFYLSEKSEESPKYEPTPEPKQEPKIEKTPYQVNRTEKVKTADKVKNEKSNKSIFILLFLGVLAIGGYFGYSEYQEGVSVWRDPDTNLMWENTPFTKADKIAFDKNHFEFGNNTNSEHLMNWHQAIQYCESLELSGYSDWRLPTIKELKTLLTDSKNDWLYIKKPMLKNTLILKGKYYFFIWSKDIANGDSSYSWILNFNDRDVYYGYRSGNDFVRCVR